MEFAIFLLLVGVILGVAAVAWSVLVQGRQMQAAKNTLNESNNCLMKYMLMAKKIPTLQYFLDSCKKSDPWGTDLRYISANNNGELNCNAASNGVLTVTVAPGDIKSSIAWIIISAGPDRQFDYSRSSFHVDLSSGDDLYVMASDMEIHNEVCQ